ncbi:Zn(2)-C6 fungal-type domain-containing protein [Mycena venus]|uniref:Zn(2)-C6 fungal-type domain-containing protein n=1 Tax=Mycena venus TaxID=2733690 RepID=A0A8H7D1C1_9AGAR|nr:Zn(2)-C6 fungal-type domain-containing protein [Mycena venus]
MPTELPFIVLQALVHNFLHNASCFGFFLDTQAFHDAITSPDGRHLPPVLLNVMYLFGVYLSGDPKITVYEPAFLTHALRSTASSLSGTHPRTILHSMQASVLLAYYFMRNARFLEGKYHISAAVSIALSAGLHRIRAADDGGASAYGTALAPPKDLAEEGERISAFWRMGASSNVSYGPTGLMIDTPWPLDIADYVEQPHLLPPQSSGTVAKFLGSIPDGVTSVAALYAKAAILYEEATRIGGVCPDESEFTALDRKIEAFTPTLPPIQSKKMLVVHTLCHCAAIQLHDPLVKALAAARAVVTIISNTDIPKVGLIDPVLATLWTTTCVTFMTEIQLQCNQQNISDLEYCVDSVIAAMENFAPHCRLMTVQLEAVRQAYAGVRSHPDP